MDYNKDNIEEIVKQVLAGMKATSVSPAPAARSASGTIPKTARVAMLTGIEKFELKSYPMPEVGDNDILVKLFILYSHETSLPFFSSVYNLHQ